MSLREWFQRLQRFVYSRSGDEWKRFFLSQGSSLREFVRNNGEKAAGLGFLLGIFLVLFFKLALIVLAAAVILIVGIIIWADSRPEDPGNP